MIQLLTPQEMLRMRPEGAEIKQFVIPDVTSRTLYAIEHYIRLLGLQDYVEIYRDAIHQSITVKYNVQVCANIVKPIIEADLDNNNKIVPNNFKIV